MVSNSNLESAAATVNEGPENRRRDSIESRLILAFSSLHVQSITRSVHRRAAARNPATGMTDKTRQGTPDRIFLIGPMGSGKTTVGRRLARSLDMEFFDLDLELQARCGVEVAVIFDIEGETGFRERESALLDELSQRDGVVLATGGGSVLSEDNRRMLTERGLVVYLQTSVDQQLRRLERDKQRPLLQAPDRRRRLTELAERRNPIYESCADLIVRSANIAPAAMADNVAQRIREHHQGVRAS